MKRVVCIRDDAQLYPNSPKVVKGNIYHVMREKEISEFIASVGLIIEGGVYYCLLEIKDCYYHSSLFVEINDNQPDEVEILEQRKEKV